MPNRFVRYTVGAAANNEKFSGLVCFEISADDKNDAIKITPTNARNLAKISLIKPITIKKSDWENRPWDTYDQFVEWCWLANKTGLETAIIRQMEY